MLNIVLFGINNKCYIYVGGLNISGTIMKVKKGFNVSSKAILYTLFILLLTFTSAVVGLGSNSYNSVQYSKTMDIKNTPTNTLWWVKDKTLPSKEEWRNTADNLYNALERDTISIKDIYGNMYVNSRNNTLFIVLTDINTDNQRAVLDIITPSENVTVIFRKGPANYIQLEEWLNQGNQILPKLREKGVKVSFLGITENATLLMEIVDINDSVIRTLINEIKGKIPESILVIRKGGFASCAWSRTDEIRPVIGAIRMYSYDHTKGKNCYSSIGFYAKNSSNVEGIIVSGHGTDDGISVYQDAFDFSKEIGETDDDPEGQYADVAWVPLIVDGVPKIYNQTSLQHQVT